MMEVTEAKTKFEDEDIYEEGLGEEEPDTDVVDEEEEKVKESGVFTLTEPVFYEGEQIRKIRYDFNNVTPVQYQHVIKAVSKKENVTVPELNTNVQFTLFCRAAQMPVAVLKSVSKIQDFTAMCAIARNFLLSKQDEEEDVL